MNKHQFFSTALAVAFLDQLTKLIVESSIRENSFLIIADFLYLTHLRNTGSVFGIFKNMNLFFAVFTLAVIAWIIYYYRKMPDNKLAKTGYAMLLGGASGNLIDRALFGGVTDFIDFRFWPAFNIADSALTMGIIMLLFYYYFTEKKVSD